MQRWSRVPVLILPITLAGCGAPSYDLFGAFFPAWIGCALIGIVAALAGRAVFVTNGLTSQVPFQLAVCTAIGVIAAVLIWLLLFEL